MQTYFRSFLTEPLLLIRLKQGVRTGRRFQEGTKFLAGWLWPQESMSPPRTHDAGHSSWNKKVIIAEIDGGIATGGSASQMTIVIRRL
jgi:hypothetical protein